MVRHPNLVGSSRALITGPIVFLSSYSDATQLNIPTYQGTRGVEIPLNFGARHSFLEDTDPRIGRRALGMRDSCQAPVDESLLQKTFTKSNGL